MGNKEEVIGLAAKLAEAILPKLGDNASGELKSAVSSAATNMLIELAEAAAPELDGGFMRVTAVIQLCPPEEGMERHYLKIVEQSIDRVARVNKKKDSEEAADSEK